MNLISEKHLARVREYMHLFTEHNCKNSEVSEILDRIYDDSGKMVRACLLIMCANVCKYLNGQNNTEKDELIYRMAALIELTHYCSLIHDDIIDDAPLRRNKISVQSLYGKNSAVFAGDVLLAKIFHQFVSEGITEISLMMTKLFEDMCIGEIYEDIRKYNPNSGIDDYMDVIYKKTALLFRTSCLISCICMDADDETKNLMAQLGEKIGLMFQIKDDLLDYTSDRTKEGKDTNCDFFEGIYTYPLLSALEIEACKDKLNPYLTKNSSGMLDRKDFEIIKSIISEYGGFQKTEDYVNNLAEECREIIEILRDKLKTAGANAPELKIIEEVVNRVQGN